MNLTRSALMDAVAEASFVGDVDGLLTLGGLPVSASVVTPTARMTIDRSTGLRTATNNTDSLTVYLSALTSEEIDQTPGALSGDSWLLFMKADVTTPPTVDSWAVVGSDRYKVVQVQNTPVDSHYRLHVRVHA